MYPLIGNRTIPLDLSPGDDNPETFILMPIDPQPNIPETNPAVDNYLACNFFIDNCSYLPPRDLSSREPRTTRNKFYAK